MNASPAMDCGAPLLCFDASVTLVGPDGSRRVAVSDLWTGPGMTTASPKELLTVITVPAPQPNTGSAYVRLQYRRQMEIAVVGAAVMVSVEGETILRARVAMTALAPTIKRAAEAEDILVRSPVSAESTARAASAFAAAADPISDVRASAHYRSAMAEVVTRRAIETAVSRARGDEVPVPASDTTFGS